MWTKTTEIKATPETDSLGDIGVEETATKKFTIRNKGKNPFVLEEIDNHINPKLKFRT